MFENSDLDHLAGLLWNFCGNLSPDSLNYVADIQLNKVTSGAGASIELVVQKALGQPVSLANYRNVQAEDVMKEVQSCLEYRGDDGSHPGLEFLDSPEGLEMRNQILELLRKLVLESKQIIGFYFKEGHPFYPVFWDFAFVIEHELDSYVLIGSSSD